MKDADSSNKILSGLSELGFAFLSGKVKKSC
jgi:hypothetical protein